MVVIYKAFCLDVAQGRMNWAPNEKELWWNTGVGCSCYLLEAM